MLRFLSRRSSTVECYLVVTIFIFCGGRLQTSNKNNIHLSQALKTFADFVNLFSCSIQSTSIIHEGEIIN